MNSFERVGTRSPIMARAIATGQRQRMRGAIGVIQILVILVLLAALGGAAWWFLQRTDGLAAVAVKAPSESTAAAPTEALGSIAVEEDVSTAELFKQARAAMSDNRMATPEGNNALEFYLRILARSPGDSSATEALRELFPFATGNAEDQIAQGHFDEANRIMALLTKADPSNYTLTILRSKLEAKRRQSERELALQTQKEAAAVSAAARTATTAPNTAPEEVAAALVVEEAPAPAKPAPIAAVAPAPAPAPAPVVPVGETRDARVVTPPSPKYPAAAVRSRQNGWVEVEFLVDADGSVKNAKVTAADPRGVFDREALIAVQKAKFEARLEKGQAVPSTLRRRIEFKMN